MGLPNIDSRCLHHSPHHGHEQVLVCAVVNATHEPVSLYDSQGNIFTFDPVPRHQRFLAMSSLPEAPAVFVMDQSYVDRFKAFGGDASRFAYVRASSDIRHDQKSYHVFWDGKAFQVRKARFNGVGNRLILADETDTEVRLGNVCVTNTPRVAYTM